MITIVIPCLCPDECLLKSNPEEIIFSVTFDMNKAQVTTPEKMSEAQVQEDNAMTPLQRLELAFKISDFASELHPGRETDSEESASIQWIELHKISS